MKIPKHKSVSHENLAAKQQNLFVRVFYIFTKTIVALYNLKKKIKTAFKASYACSCCYLIKKLPSAKWRDSWLVFSILTNWAWNRSWFEFYNFYSFLFLKLLAWKIHITVEVGWDLVSFSVYCSLNYLLRRQRSNITRMKLDSQFQVTDKHLHLFLQIRFPKWCQLCYLHLYDALNICTVVSSHVWGPWLIEVCLCLPILQCEVKWKWSEVRW